MNLNSGPNDPAIVGNATSKSLTSALPSISVSCVPPAWSSQTSTFPVNNNTAAGSSFPRFSASTAAILERLQGKGGHPSGSAAFEAKRAEVLQNYVTSDKLPTPPPIPGNNRRGRGGKAATPSRLKTDANGTPNSASSARGSARSRARGRGRGKGGKRKRSDANEESKDEDDSDISDSYTPLPTRTKSGRSVIKPVAFVPTIPEPSQGAKRRKSTKTLLAAKCKTCHRETDPSNNRIVFCDACSAAYHQYCHRPPISNEVVTVLEKEWLCGPCTRAKQSVAPGAEELVAAEALSLNEKRAYFSTLPVSRLVSLLLTAVIRYPDLPVFAPNAHDIISNAASSSIEQYPMTAPPSFPQPQYQLQPPLHPSLCPRTNDHTSIPPGFNSHPTDDPPSAQLLSETHSHIPPPPPQPRASIDLVGTQYEGDDGYDTDPPAHYPKPGHGLARTLRPECDDLNWLVDDNFEVFSHGWKGDGTGLGADASSEAVGGETKMA